MSESTLDAAVNAAGSGPLVPLEGRNGAPPRVLFVRLGAIGDVCNALTIASALREACPDAHIGWAVHPLSLPLVDGHPSVDRVHVWTRGGRSAGLRSLVGEVRKERYDVAVDLQRLQKSGLLARLSGAQRVLGFDRRRAKEQSWLWTRERISKGPKSEHMVLQYQRFRPLLGIPPGPVLRELPHDPAAADWAREQVQGTTPTLLNLGASKPNKRWPAASFREVAKRLIHEDRGPVWLTGGPGDQAVAKQVAEGLNLINVAGGTSLPQLWELARRSSRMVTADTGPMHLCAAVGTPVVAIFGPGTPTRTGPWGPGHVVLRGDRPLSLDLTGTSKGPGGPMPMNETLPRAVLTALSGVE